MQENLHMSLYKKTVAPDKQSGATVFAVRGYRMSSPRYSRFIGLYKAQAITRVISVLGII